MPFMKILSACPEYNSFIDNPTNISKKRLPSGPKLDVSHGYDMIKAVKTTSAEIGRKACIRK